MKGWDVVIFLAWLLLVYGFVAYLDRIGGMP